jgi:hypothetical protein
MGNDARVTPFRAGSYIPALCGDLRLADPQLVAAGFSERHAAQALAWYDIDYNPVLEELLPGDRVGDAVREVGRAGVYVYGRMPLSARHKQLWRIDLQTSKPVLVGEWGGS